MNSALARLVRRFVGRDSLALPPDFDPRAGEIIREVRAFTMTSPERLFSLIGAARYVAAARIPGGVVECGVWRGGSMMAAALALLDAGDNARELFLFDTFEGMTSPTAHDVTVDGQSARELLAEPRSTGADSAWCYAALPDVQAALSRTKYPAERLHFVPGRVEETLAQHAPTSIAILRLDTDWYESTRHELEHLYPRLSPGGVLIIDDYGHWAGCRKAVDEYFAAHGIRILLNRVDYTGRIAVKPA